MMKTKLRSKLAGAVVCTAAFIFGMSPITAFAQSNEDAEEKVCICEIKCTEDCINEECEVCKEDYTKCEGKEPEEPVEPEHYGPLTPDGNLTLVDDYGTLEAGGKQFITVVTKAGNYFYIIIDRDDEGEETVHFLNMVDEADLLSLMDDEAVEDYIAATGEKKVEPTPTPEPVKEEPVEEEPVTPEPKKTGSKVPIVLLILGLGGVGGYMYLKKNKGRKSVNEGIDPDLDYREDEDDYLSSLPDDIEDDEEIDEPDVVDEVDEIEE